MLQNDKKALGNISCFCSFEKNSISCSRQFRMLHSLKFSPSLSVYVCGCVQLICDLTWMNTKRDTFCICEKKYKKWKHLTFTGETKQKGEKISYKDTIKTKFMV